MHLIYKLGNNHSWVEEYKTKIGKKREFSSTGISSWDPSSKHIFKHFYKPTVSEEISTPIAFQPLLQPDNCMCFFRDLWSSISNSSHCFISPNGFSNLLCLNLIVLHVNSKWAYTDFMSYMQLVKDHQPAILPAMLQKSCLTPKNMMESAFLMKFLNSLGLGAQWGHTVRRTLNMRNFLCPLQAYLLPERCLAHEGKGVSVTGYTSLLYYWRVAVAVWGVSLLNLLICSTHTGQGDALRQWRPHLLAPSDVH